MTDHPSALVSVPRDDDQRPFSDSLLPGAMIYAGSDALDRAQMDMANYVSGETIDWDQGMMAVAVYRAMLAAAPSAPQAAGVGEIAQIITGYRNMGDEGDPNHAIAHLCDLLERQSLRAHPLTPREQYEQAKRDFNNMRDDGTITPREKVEQAVKDAIREDASVGLQMTLTPQFMRGLVDRVLSATSVVDHEAGLASDKPTALASGSGDHAELAKRLWDRLDDEDAFAAASALEALLAENAALREKADASEAHWKAYARARVAEAQHAENFQLTRATEAERKLAEAVWLLRRIEGMCPATCETSLAHDMAQIASEWLSKEAERG